MRPDHQTSPTACVLQHAAWNGGRDEGRRWRQSSAGCHPTEHWCRQPPVAEDRRINGTKSWVFRKLKLTNLQLD